MSIYFQTTIFVSPTTVLNVLAVIDLELAVALLLSKPVPKLFRN